MRYAPWTLRTVSPHQVLHLHLRQSHGRCRLRFYNGMGKCLACLLLAAAGMIPAQPAFAHEQTRRVQDELRNRHLFYGNTTGEYSPELMAALKRYQARKGLGATGVIDPATLASLDIPGSPPPVEELSVMTAQRTPGPVSANDAFLEARPVE